MNPETQDAILRLLKDIDAGRVKIFYTEVPYDEEDDLWTFVSETGWKIEIWKREKTDDMGRPVPENEVWGQIERAWKPNGAVVLREDLYPGWDDQGGMNKYPDEVWGSHPIHEWGPKNLSVWKNALPFNDLARVAQIVRTSTDE